MKNQFTLLLLGILISASVFSQPPQAFKYQAVVRDATGDIISNQTVNIRISIHNETPGGTIIYQETFSETTNQFGLVNLNIGLGTPSIGFFAGIDWKNDSKFIEVEIGDGVDYISLGTSELFSVPYSLYSGRSADSYWLLNNGSVCFENGNVGIGTANPLDNLHVADHIRVGEDLTYPTIYGEIKHDGSSNGLVFNSAGGSWADMHFQTQGTTKMFIESAGSVGIGTTSPSARLTVKSSGYTGGMYVLASDDDRIFRIRQNSDGSGTAYLFDDADNATVAIGGGGNSYFTADNVGVGTTTPNAKLHVNDRIRVGEDPTYGNVFGELIHEGGGSGFKINANAGGSWADMYLQTDGNTRVFIESGGNVGIGTTSPSSKLDVRGNITVRNASTGSIVMELGTGLDYAEGFNVSNNNVEPGTILCIDPENPGQLKVSEKPYDKTVAGIVAGANGLGSGVRLGNREFDCDVALAGRVYCNTIAINENIEPGDLLTTSSIPGYAMKVNDFKISQGAILGKAMESLEKGKQGQILVLVTLQ
ncbi:MAG: hypothetical protein K9H58_08110 [Bacteroidales bacterium]|nr:hypothetical protein [Bacteroidales bacterium]